MKDKANITVSDESLQATTNCEKRFTCLRGKSEALCAVESCIDGKVHFIKCLNDVFCPYQHSFGNGYLCTCPTRKEIYNKYNF
jgi:hypothetical protein